MRRLSAKQIKELKKLANKGIGDIYDVPSETYVKIESYNDYETFFTDADRYLSDNCKFLEKEW
jgi:hypothetical protein